MSERSSNWVMVVALLPAMLTPIIVAMSRGNGAEVRAWFVQWHGVVEQLMLFLAFAALAAAVIAGVVTWRRAGRREGRYHA